MADWAETCRIALQIGAGLWIQSSFLLLIGLVAGWLLRRKGPLFEAAAYRAALCAVLLSAFLAIALFGRIRPMWHIALPVHAAAGVSSPAMPVREALSPPHRSGHIVRSRRTVQLSTQPRIMSSRSRPLSWAQIYIGIALVWCAVSLTQIVWLLLGAVTLLRIGRHAETDRNSREAQLLEELAGQAGVAVPRLIVHQQIRSPFVAGVFRPMIVVPAGLLELDEPVARAVLSHELGHLAQRDSAWVPVFRIVMALGWPQPLLRVLYRRWLSASEYACDKWALGNGCPPRDYAECLMRLAEEKPPFRAAQILSLGVAPFRSLLGKRIQQILSWSGGRMQKLSRRARYTMGVFAVVIGCATVFLVSANTGARATGRRFAQRVAHSLTSLPGQNPRLSASPKHDVTNPQGASMNRIGSRMLSTVAAVAGGLVQVNLPAVAAPVANPHIVHAASPAHAQPLSSAAPKFQVTKNADGTQLISLNCNNMPIREAFVQLFRATGLKYTLPADLSGNVTVNAASVPLGTALRIITDSSDHPLTYLRVGNSCWIRERSSTQNVAASSVDAPPAPAQPLPPVTADYLAHARQYKMPIDNISAAAMAEELNGDDIRQSGQFPSQARIVVSKADNMLMVFASPDDFQRLREIIKMIDVPIRQAQVRVTLVDMSEEELRAMGLSSHSLGGDPNSKAVDTLTKALKAGKLSNERSILLTANNTEQVTGTMDDVESGGLVVEATPTVLSNNTISTHLEGFVPLLGNQTHYFSYTTKLFSDETTLVAVQPEEGSKYRLIFVGSSILSDAEQRREDAMRAADSTPSP